MSLWNFRSIHKVMFMNHLNVIEHDPMSKSSDATFNRIFDQMLNQVVTQDWQHWVGWSLIFFQQMPLIRAYTAVFLPNRKIRRKKVSFSNSKILFFRSSMLSWVPIYEWPNKDFFKLFRVVIRWNQNFRTIADNRNAHHLFGWYWFLLRSRNRMFKWNRSFHFDSNGPVCHRCMQSR